jgi:hypothetical protein
MMRGTAVASMLAIAFTACAREQSERTDAPGSPAGGAAAAPAAGPPARPQLQLSPRGGPAGSEVTISFSGLAMREPVEIGFGDMGEHVILSPAQADVDGNISTTVRVPADATPVTHFFFLANSETGQVVATPTAFLVMPADGRVTVSGRMSDEGVECRAMRGDAGELYSLTGPDDWPEPGTKVTVVGRIAEMSMCQQGLTIAVESIKAVP